MGKKHLEFMNLKLFKNKNEINKLESNNHIHKYLAITVSATCIYKYI